MPGIDCDALDDHNHDKENNRHGAVAEDEAYGEELFGQDGELVENIKEGKNNEK